MSSLRVMSRVSEPPLALRILVATCWARDSRPGMRAAIRS